MERDVTDSIVISTEQLTRVFGERVALREIDFTVHRGEVFGLLGHNGAGKTTTIRLLNGLLPPTSGRIRVLGMDPVESGSAVRSRTGVLTETPALDRRLSGRENLAYSAELFDIEPERAKRRIEFLIDVFDLDERGNDRVETYSRGMHQRIALARAMLHEPDLLFLDEPTSALDPVATRVLHLMIMAFRSDGGSVLLCTHNLDEAERLCDRIGIIENGRLIAVGSTEELISSRASQVVEVEVGPGHAERACAAVERVAPGVRATVQENLVLVEGLNRDMVPAVVDTLAGAGIPVFRVTPASATLEDVYLALHGQNEVA